MSDFDLLDLTAEQLTAAYRAGTLSPVDVAEQSLARMDELEPVLHAFYTVTPEIARAEAEASAGRYRAGETIGALDGVPYSIKDLEATKGIRTTLGSAVTKDWVPDYDTVTAERLRSSGGVLLGKTVAPHMGYKDSSENLIQEPTENPWKPGYNPRGSSSGAAASVAARYSPVAQGSDGAGSIRIPSALSGTVGFKASIGRVPVSPQRNYLATTVHNGPITRSVRDAALLLDVLAGPDRRDPLSLYELPDDGFLGSLDTLGEHERGRRIVLSTDFGYGWTSPVVSEAVRTSAALLE